jgi:hypothetical protein
MGLLNHLFGNRKSRGKEIILDNKKIIALWNRYLSSFSAKEELSKNFSFKNIDETLKSQGLFYKTLDGIQQFISEEFIEITAEKRKDDEILFDLERLSDSKSISEANSLAGEIVYEKQKQKKIILLLTRIHDALKLELHAIGLLRKNPGNARNTALQLFRLIFNYEAMLIKAFRKEFFNDQSAHREIQAIVKAVILEQDLKEELESDEDKFANEMVQKMHEDSKHHYRKLGENIYYDLAEMAGAPLGVGGDVLAGIARLEKLMRNDKIMFDIIRKRKPKFGEREIKAAIVAFRKAYNLGHFMELEAEFVT